MPSGGPSSSPTALPPPSPRVTVIAGLHVEELVPLTEHAEVARLVVRVRADEQHVELDGAARSRECLLRGAQRRDLEGGAGRGGDAEHASGLEEGAAGHRALGQGESIVHESSFRASGRRRRVPRIRWRGEAVLSFCVEITANSNSTGVGDGRQRRKISPPPRPFRNGAAEITPRRRRPRASPRRAGTHRARTRTAAVPAHRGGRCRDAPTAAGTGRIPPGSSPRPRRSATDRR